VAFKNLGKRVLVAGIGGPLVVAALWFGGYFLLLLVMGIGVLTAFEFFALLQSKGSAPAKALVILALLALYALVFFGKTIWLMPLAAVFVLLLVSGELFRKENNAILNTGGGLLTFAYLGLYAFIVAVRELPAGADLPYRAGGEWLVLVFLTIWVCDSAAYFVGSKFGKRKLSASVSPNKSVEGAAGGVVFAILTAYLCQVLFAHSLAPQQAMIIGVIIGIFGQAGDLVESLFKRDAAIKDTSNILPGHGGILDRFDSQLLAVPLVYFYLLLVVVG